METFLDWYFEFYPSHIPEFIRSYVSPEMGLLLLMFLSIYLIVIFPVHLLSKKVLNPKQRSKYLVIIAAFSIFIFINGLNSLYSGNSWPGFFASLVMVFFILMIWIIANKFPKLEMFKDLHSDLKLKDGELKKNVIPCPNCSKKTISSLHIGSKPQTCGECLSIIYIDEKFHITMIFISILMLVLVLWTMRYLTDQCIENEAFYKLIVMFTGMILNGVIAKWLRNRCIIIKKPLV